MPEYKNPKPTVDALVELQGGLLLVQRGRPPFQGTWALPGGFVDLGETTEQAVLRELEEETGLQGRIVRLFGVYSDPARDPRGPTIGIIYEVARVAGEPRAGDDAKEVRVWPLDRLPELAFDHGRIVADWLRARRPQPKP